MIILSCHTQGKNLGPHVHGYVSLDMAVEKNELLVMLKSPATSFLGFEHKAKSDYQRKKIKETSDNWKKNILEFISQGSLNDCKVKTSSWVREFHGKSHSNIIAESYIECKKPIKNRDLVISMKKKYPLIQTVSFQLIKENGSITSKEYQDDTFYVKL